MFPGASVAVGTDVDSLAVRAAARNAELNDVAERFVSLLCDPTIDGPEPVASSAVAMQALSASASGRMPLANQANGSGPLDSATASELAGAGPSSRGLFDVCIANILRGPLVELRPRLAQYVRPGGIIILSGILLEQADEIIQSYSDEFEQFEVQSESTWALVSAIKRGSPK